MALPKRRTSKTRKRKRRSHHALSAPNIIECPNCGEPVVPHRACASCGEYNGRKVLEVEE